MTLQLQRLERKSQQVKVGRGVRDEAYGEGRRARRGSRYARQGEALCAERNEAAISREVRRKTGASKSGRSSVLAVAQAGVESDFRPLRFKGMRQWRNSMEY